MQKLLAPGVSNYIICFNHAYVEINNTMNKAAILADARHNEPLVRYRACKAMAKGFANSIDFDDLRVEYARTFCASVISAYWATLCKKNKTKIKVKSSVYMTDKIESDVLALAQDSGELIASFPIEDAGYLIGSIYTVMLPNSLRSKLGAYYTPPPLVSRLLDIAESAGVDFSKDTVIDPACGGGAFLAPVALRMLKSMKQAPAEWTLQRISNNLTGIEIDPFAAWMASVLLEAALMPLCVKARRRLPNVVVVGDALTNADVGKFDLVIGNPPYGRVKLDPEQRELYARSLFGHANLYGLFTDLALRLAKEKGVIAYLTPTSFLGGRYFKSLRKLLIEDTTPVAIDFVADRNGVFDDVLQETLLTAYRKEKSRKLTSLSLITPQGLNSAKVAKIGKAKIPTSGAPWVLPRNAKDAKFIFALSKMGARLSDLGLSVSTGPLVWNRHKPQLKSMKLDGALPLVWAESIAANEFQFSSKRKNHVPYIVVKENQPHLITKHSCALLQRTTAKEQNRRLICSVLPQEFLDDHGGAVIENHINMITTKNVDNPPISVRTISILLNTKAVDRAFRGISGSVAVSAYELNALPLPSLDDVMELEQLIESGCTQETIENKVASYYGDYE